MKKLVALAAVAGLVGGIMVGWEWADRQWEEYVADARKWGWRD